MKSRLRLRPRPRQLLVLVLVLVLVLLSAAPQMSSGPPATDHTTALSTGGTHDPLDAAA